MCLIPDLLIRKINRSVVSNVKCCSMALSDVTNTCSSYIPQIKLPSKCAPLIRRGKSLDTQASRSSFPLRRARGESNIDLWVDGRIWPIDPRTEEPPSFRSTKDYLEFLCEGENGMLGYTKRLKTGGSVQELESRVSTLQGLVAEYEGQIQHLRNLCMRLESEASITLDAAAQDGIDRRNLCLDVERLEARCEELSGNLARSEHRTHANDVDHREKVESMDTELQRCKLEYQKLEEKLRSMVRTPRGFRQRVHGKSMKSLADLAGGSGHAKRQRALMRAMLQPAVVAAIRSTNKVAGGKKRLAGDSTTQAKTAACLASILRPAEAAAMVEQPRMSQAKASVVKDVIRQIGDSIGSDSMLDACDSAGVTVRGYDAIYRTVKNRIGMVAPGIKSGILPAPHRLGSLRKEMNLKLPQFIGDYYHIDGRRTIPEVRVGGKVVTAAKEVVLDSKNSLFVELEVVQRSMVMFYEMTTEGNFPFVCIIGLSQT